MGKDDENDIGNPKAHQVEVARPVLTTAGGSWGRSQRQSLPLSDLDPPGRMFSPGPIAWV
jgi:hypothetical protein